MFGFYWYFYQDGGIDYEVKLTGIVNSSAVPPNTQPKNGTLVAPQVVAHNHQHYFNVRLDMMVDGLENSVYEVDTVRDPLSTENPHGNAFSTKKTLLKEEKNFPRKIDPFAARYWTVSNHSKKNYMGESVSYKIAPGENLLPFQTSINLSSITLKLYLFAIAPFLYENKKFLKLQKKLITLY